MGDNAVKERSFRNINELTDQKDAPGWIHDDTGLKISVRHVYESDSQSVMKRQEYIIVAEINRPAIRWVIPKQVGPSVIEGMRNAAAYEHPDLATSEGGHFIRTIMLNYVGRTTENPQTLVGAIGQDIMKRRKLVIAVALRKGRTREGILYFEKNVIFTDMNHVLMLPATRIETFIEVFRTAVERPPGITIYGSDREYVIGYVR